MGFESISTNKIKGFLQITTDYLKHPKEVRAALELKMYLILKQKTSLKSLFLCFAPGVGFEPTTNWLTANCATAALPGNKRIKRKY